MNIQDFNRELVKENLRLFFSDKWVDSESLRLLDGSSVGFSGSGQPTYFQGVAINWENSPPLINEPAGISISHSKLGGAILFSPNRRGLGVDVEITDRFNPKLIARVSTEEERKAAPHENYLWPAKEAAFKSLYPDNENIIVPELKIQNWVQISEKIWKFSCVRTGTSSLIAGHLFDTQPLLIATSFLVSD